MNARDFQDLFIRRLILFAALAPALPITLAAVIATLGGAFLGIVMLVTWAAPAGAIQYVATLLGFGVGWLGAMYFGVPRLYRWSLAPAFRHDGLIGTVAQGTINRER